MLLGNNNLLFVIILWLRRSIFLFFELYGKVFRGKVLGCF